MRLCQAYQGQQVLVGEPVTGFNALASVSEQIDDFVAESELLIEGGVRGAGATMVAGPAAGGQIVCEEMPVGPSIEGGGP